MKLERKQRLLHELGFTALEVRTVEELSAKRGLLAPDLLRSAVSLLRLLDLGQVVVMTLDRYKQLTESMIACDYCGQQVDENESFGSLLVESKSFCSRECSDDFDDEWQGDEDAKAN